MRGVKRIISVLILIVLVAIVIILMSDKGILTSSTITGDFKEKYSFEENICIKDYCHKCNIICEDNQLISVECIDENCSDFNTSIVGNEVCG